MKAKRSRRGKKYFTVAEANAALPLVRAIVKDIAQVAPELRDRQERLDRIAPPDAPQVGAAHQEEVEELRAQVERDLERMCEFVEELNKLGVELKDAFTGLLDFPCRMNDREVYLCWRLGESEVGHWHELQAGYAGRQKITKAETKPQGV